MKNKILLSIFFVLAFLVLLVPQSHASYEYNGVTLPDLPDTLPDQIANIDMVAFDYMIYDYSPADEAYNLLIIYYSEKVTESSFYLDSTLGKVWINPNGNTYYRVNYWYIPEQHTEWEETSASTNGSTNTYRLDLGSNVQLWAYSSFDIYEDETLDTVFFQKTPSTTPTPMFQTVTEMVKEETPKMAEKILEAMKILVVFSISCLILLISLPIFSKVFSIFRVK